MRGVNAWTCSDLSTRRPASTGTANNEVMAHLLCWCHLAKGIAHRSSRWRLNGRYFTVLTFDTPGFSRSHVQTADDISVSKLAEQIAGLVESLGTCPATFYGCSSGAVAVLDLVVRHPELVRNAVVHEVAMAGAAALLADLPKLNDAAIVESCKFVYGHVMNDDLAAWEALGDEYHARLANNYVTWVRRYVAPSYHRRIRRKISRASPLHGQSGA